MNPSELAGKIIRLPCDGGTDYFRAITYDDVYKNLLVYKLAVEVRPGGTMAISPRAFAIKPERKSLSLLQSVSDELLVPVELELPSATNKHVVSLDKKQKATYESTTGLLLKVIDLEKLRNDLIYRHYADFLKDAAKLTGAKRMTLTRLIGGYFQFGMDSHKVAMMGIFADRRRSKTRAVTKKLGRKRKLVASGHAPHLEGINCGDLNKQDIKLFLDQTPDRHGKGPSKLYSDFRERFVAKKVGTLANGEAVMAPDPEKDITLSQFTRELQKLESARQREIRMVSKSKWNKDFRLLIGTARDGVRYPGQLYIIDSTVADVYLVCAIDGKILVGRPVIYAVIDAFSSVILAIHVTVDTANADQAKIALYRAMTSKDGWLASVRAPYEFGAALPAGCTPAAIFCDRGELLSLAGLEIAKSMNVALRLAAPYRADWKSLVERFFGIINDKVLHWAPGGVRARELERGERDVRYDAVLTIHGLQRLMLSLAAEWNQTHNMEGHVSAGMLRAGDTIEATPISFWNYGMKHLHPAAVWLTPDDAKRKLLPTFQSVLSRKGAQLLEGLRFTADWMQTDDRYFAQSETKRAQMILDPDDPMGAFMIDEDSGELRHTKLVDTRDYCDYDTAVEDIRVVEAYMELIGAEAAENHKTIVDTHKAYRTGVIKAQTEKAKADKLGDTRSLADQVKNVKQVQAAMVIGPGGRKKTEQLPPPIETFEEFGGWEASIEKIIKQQEKS